MRFVNVPLIAIAFVLAAMCLSGCGTSTAEMREAKALARTLRNLAPEARQLLEQENNCANELKITLDENETGQLESNAFRERFNGYIDQLIAIRDKRRQILGTLRQGIWQSPMVFVVQHDALMMMQDEIARTDTWIRLAQNVRLRADLGHKTAFPELPVLRVQLDGFLGQTAEDPLGIQLRALEEEFRFGESELDS